MSFSYSGDPTSSDLDKVRFEIQDTDASAVLLQDAEILYTLIDEAGDPPYAQQAIFAAAARCCEALARRFAMQADTTIGSLQTTYSRMQVTYAQRASELRQKASAISGPYVGGQSRSEKEAGREDPDRVQPRFSRDEFRNPMTGSCGPIGPGVWE